jgi:hypothetical protein
MTTLDTLLHVVEHAKRWQIGDHQLKQVSANAAQFAFQLPDNDLDLFMQWARHLEDSTIMGIVPGPIGVLAVRGQIMSGHPVAISVISDGLAMRFHDLMGVVVLGEVEQYARKVAEQAATAGKAGDQS